MNDFSLRDTTISFFNRDEREADNWLRHRFEHYGIQHRLFNMLRDEGFEIISDNCVVKSIRRNHFVGKKSELKFKSHRYPNGFEVTFFQEINTENPNGGFYDFDKFQKMPYLVKKQFILVSNVILKFLENFADNKTIPVYQTAEDKIKAFYVKSWHHPQKDMNFNLSDLNGTTCEYSYNNTDRNGKTIFNGDFKYFRDRSGYLACGTVYCSLNNMWWVIVNDSEANLVEASELFDLSESDSRKRVKRGSMPKEYILKSKILSECSAMELKRELKRRKSNVI